MDPNELVRLVREAMRDKDYEDAMYLHNCLMTWVERGWFLPDGFDREELRVWMSEVSGLCMVGRLG